MWIWTLEVYVIWLFFSFFISNLIIEVFWIWSTTLMLGLNLWNSFVQGIACYYSVFAKPNKWIITVG